MRALRLTSSFIDRALYDDDTGQLSLWFRDSGLYVYSQVPSSIFEELGKAASAGHYFARHIKGRYPCRFDPRRRKFRPWAMKQEDRRPGTKEPIAAAGSSSHRRHPDDDGIEEE